MYTTYNIHIYIRVQEKAGDVVGPSTDVSSPTGGENDQSYSTSPAAKSPQDKLPPAKPEPLVMAATTGDKDGGEGT